MRNHRRGSDQGSEVVVVAGAGPAPVAVRHVASSTCTSDSARQASQQAPGQIATLIVPADVAWNEATHAAPALPVTPPAAVGDNAIAHAVAALRSGRPAALLLRGPALRGRGLVAAGRIARATGVRLLCDTFAPRLECGAGRVVIERLPYFAEQLVDTLTPLEHLLLVGSTPPVAFFASPGEASWCSPDGCRIDVLSQDELGATALVRSTCSNDNPCTAASTSSGRSSVSSWARIARRRVSSRDSASAGVDAPDFAELRFVAAMSSTAGQRTTRESTSPSNVTRPGT